MSRSKSYINTFYLAVHLLLNITVIALIINLIDIYVPFKQLYNRYHLNVSNFYGDVNLQKVVAPVMALGIAVWYYQRRKAKSGDNTFKK